MQRVRLYNFHSITIGLKVCLYICCKKTGADFKVDGYAIGVYVELRQTLKCLVEEGLSDGNSLKSQSQLE